MIEVLARMRLPVAPVLPDEVARKADLIAGDSPDYSLSAVDTNVKWVDGSPVLRRVLITATGAPLNVPNAVGLVPDFSGLVRLDAYCIGLDNFRVPMGYYTSPTAYFSVMIHEDGNIVELHGNAAYSDRRMIVIVDYIGEPTTISSWDGGTTSWDNGTTFWDMQ